MHVFRAEDDAGPIPAERGGREDRAAGFDPPDFVPIPARVISMEDAGAIADEEPSLSEDRRGPKPTVAFDLPAGTAGPDLERAQAPVDRGDEDARLTHSHRVTDRRLEVRAPPLVPSGCIQRVEASRVRPHEREAAADDDFRAGACEFIRIIAAPRQLQRPGGKFGIEPGALEIAVQGRPVASKRGRGQHEPPCRRANPLACQHPPTPWRRGRVSRRVL